MHLKFKKNMLNSDSDIFVFLQERVQRKSQYLMEMKITKCGLEKVPSPPSMAQTEFTMRAIMALR